MRRRREQALVDPATHPKRFVSLKNAAAYLEIDPKTLNKIIDAQLIDVSWKGSLRRLEVAAIAAYEERERQRRKHG